MKKTTKTLSATILILLILPLATYAQKKAIFPDATKLQPIPVYIHPNVSGNTNSQLNPPLQNSAPVDQTFGQTQSARQTNNQNATNSQNIEQQTKSFPWSIAYIIFALLAIFWLFWMFKKASEDN